MRKMACNYSMLFVVIMTWNLLPVYSKPIAQDTKVLKMLSVVDITEFYNAPLVRIKKNSVVVGTCPKDMIFYANQCWTKNKYKRLKEQDDDDVTAIPVTDSSPVSREEPTQEDKYTHIAVTNTQNDIFNVIPLPRVNAISIKSTLSDESSGGDRNVNTGTTVTYSNTNTQQFVLNASPVSNDPETDTKPVADESMQEDDYIKSSINTEHSVQNSNHVSSTEKTYIDKTDASTSYHSLDDDDNSTETKNKLIVTGVTLCGLAAVLICLLSIVYQRCFRRNKVKRDSDQPSPTENVHDTEEAACDLLLTPCQTSVL